MVKLDAADGRVPVLQWYSIKKGEQYGGEMLAAFELFRVSGHQEVIFGKIKQCVVHSALASHKNFTKKYCVSLIAFSFSF
jgi:hypothetical protein